MGVLINIVLNIGITLHVFLTWLGLRRTRHWGVVYDSSTKQPVDPVILKLINATTGDIVATSTANLKGEYGFLVTQGLYKIYVQRQNYRFPSELVDSYSDGIYANIYRGETFEFKGSADVVSLNIPLDPISEDWNQKAKLLVYKVRPGLENFYRVTSAIFFWVSFVLCFLAWWVSRDGFWATIVFIYLFIFITAVILPEVRLWGRVKYKNGNIPYGMSIELTHFKLPSVVIAKALISDSGKFFIRVSKGKYLLKIIDTDKKAVYSTLINVGSTGLLNKEFRI